MARDRKMDREEMRRKAREQAKRETSGGGSNYIRLPEGKEFLKTEEEMWLDIIAYEVTSRRNPDFQQGELATYRNIRTHRDIGPTKDIVLCPLCIGKPCPICEEVNILREAGYEENKKLIDAYSAKRRQLFPVIDRRELEKANPKKPSEYPIRILEISFHCFGKLFFKELGRREDNVDYMFLEDGKSIRLYMAEQHLGGNKYHEAERIDFEPRGFDYPAEIHKHVPDLDECLVALPYERLRSMFHGIEEPDTDTAPTPEDEAKMAARERRETRTQPKAETQAAGKLPHGEPEPPMNESAWEQWVDHTVDGVVESGDWDALSTALTNAGVEIGSRFLRRAARTSESEDVEVLKAELFKTPPSFVVPDSARTGGNGDEPTAEKPECPNGYKFGIDADKYEECEVCKLWKPCAAGDDVAF